MFGLIRIPEIYFHPQIPELVSPHPQSWDGDKWDPSHPFRISSHAHHTRRCPIILPTFLAEPKEVCPEPNKHIKNKTQLQIFVVLPALCGSNWQIVQRIAFSSFEEIKHVRQMRNGFLDMNHLLLLPVMTRPDQWVNNHFLSPDFSFQTSKFPLLI